MHGFPMLRAALIGFAASGKTTLFQLMTSAVGTARAAHGKGETTVGISKVPDQRLDRLTATVPALRGYGNTFAGPVAYRWLVLAGFAAVFALATVWVLRHRSRPGTRRRQRSRSWQ